MASKKLRPSPPAGTSSRPPRNPPTLRSQAPPAAAHDRMCTRRMAANAAKQAQKIKHGESVGSATAARAVTRTGAVTRSTTRTLPRPRFPSQADRNRARARMARDLALVEPGRGDQSEHPRGEQVATWVRVTTGPSGVDHVPPRKLLYLVKIKLAGQKDIVRCVAMDLNSKIDLDDF